MGGGVAVFPWTGTETDVACDQNVARMLTMNILCLKRRKSARSVDLRPQPPPRKTPPPRMAPTPPLPVTEDTPADMLAGSMELPVLLPDGSTTTARVQRGTPMMDLLVQICTAQRMPAGGHVLRALGEGRAPLPYKPSTPIGALHACCALQVAPRRHAPAPKRPAPAMPFQHTFRLQVHLPRNQLYVTRVSPNVILGDILKQTCNEKNLDPNKYELRHPVNVEECLRTDLTLADYNLHEVTLVAKGRQSSTDIMALQREEQKRREQVKSGKILPHKITRNDVPEGSVSSDSLGGRSLSPTHSDESPSPPGSTLPLPPPRPVRKRRPAPPPPSQPVKADPVPAAQQMISHSRNSSDSSGYHEASVLSESPDTQHSVDSPASTLPRRSKLPSGSATNSSAHTLSRSLSSLTSSSAGAMRPAASTSSLTSTGQGHRKKKAPPPPPVLAKLAASNKSQSSSALHSYSSSTDRSEILMKTASLDRNSTQRLTGLDKSSTLPHGGYARSDIQSDILVESSPEPVRAYKQSDHASSTGSEDRNSSIELTPIVGKISPIVTRSPSPSSGRKSPLGSNVRKTPSPCTNRKSPVLDSGRTSPLSTTSSFAAVERTPKPVVAVTVDTKNNNGSSESGTETDVEEMTNAFKSVTDELEAAILADELKEVEAPPLPPSPPPEKGEGLPDWEYQLPAPPSAFRDSSSPVPTIGETVPLVDSLVFKDEITVTRTNPVFDATKFIQETENTRDEKTKKTSDITDNSFITSCVSSETGEQELSICQVGSNTKTNVLNNNARDIKMLEKSTRNQRPQLERQSSMQRSSCEETYDRKIEQVVDEIIHHKLLGERACNKQSIVRKLSTSSEDTNIGKLSFRTSSNVDLSQSSSLSNFTITTYSRSTNVVDEETTVPFKQPMITTEYSRSRSVARAGSFSQQSTYEQQHLAGRAQSLVSLERSLGNESLHKTTSVQDLKQGTSKWGGDYGSELQSLQVLRSILPELSQSFQTKRKDSHSSNSSTESREEASEKRYSYRGPPAVNFATWSERPKSQVSIKVDSDYRISSGSGSANKSTNQPKDLADTANDGTVPLSRVNASSDQPKNNLLQKSDISLRFIAHTTASGFKKQSQANKFSVSETNVSKPASDPSRVPIVRAVELKKTVVQQYSLDSKLANENQSSNLVTVNQNVNNKEQPEIFMGVNSLAKRFSKPNVQVNATPKPRPVSAYFTSSSYEPKQDQGLYRSTSSTNITSTDSSIGPKKFTSVIGINGSYQGTNTSSVKVNGFLPAKQPMPVVKGFRLAQNGLNHSDTSLLNGNSSKNDAGSKMTRAESWSNKPNWRTSVEKIQGATTTKVVINGDGKSIRPTEVDSRVNPGNSEPLAVPPPPPKVPAFRPSAQRQPPAVQVDPREQLLAAIRSFGGRSNLRQVRDLPAQNVILAM